MRHPVARAAAAITTLALITASPVAAHEQRTVGALQLTVGWQHEPAYVGDLNAVQVFVHDARGDPIDDLGEPPTLQVTVGTGALTSRPLTLDPSFDPDTGLGTHGEFDAPIIPETPGTYRFHFAGTIGGQRVDQTFTSSGRTFDDVVAPDAVEFPTAEPPPGDLATAIKRLQPRVETALSTAHTSHRDASTATTLAIVALVIAVVSAVLAAMRRRHA